ncbi:MAG: hypothetical protein QOJ29_37, partial [Thermoleophilaceae bacterium]|nr:hypothetical protein [Thermoleophilaceae bacterium]
PTTSNAYRSTAPASLDADIVLTKLAYDPAGTPALRIDYSTYFGGSGYDLDPAVAVDDNDFVFVTGVTRSSDFPTRNAAQATPGDEHDAFVAKFDTSPAPNPGDASLIWSTYYGGSSTDIPHGIALDGQEVFVVGETQSTDLPSTEAIGPFTHVTDGSETDAFLVSFLATGQSDGVRDATTYIGGTGYDSASGVVARRSYGGLDVQYIVGTTDASSSNFPLRGSLSDSVGGTKHVWVMKLQTSPQIIWSTLLGGSSGAQDIGAAIAQNRFAQAPGAEFRDHVYITGFAGGDYPHTDTLQPSFGGGVDAFVSRIDEAQPQIFSPEPGRVRPTGTIAFTYGVPQHNDGLSFACSEGADPDNPGHLENQLISCPVGSKSYTGLAEGPQLFQVQTVDESGDRSEPTEFPFVVDLNPPPAFDLVAPDDGARTGTTPTLQWQQAHDAATAVTYHVIVGGSDVVQVPESVCSANTCSVKLAALPTGSHTWQVHAVDEGQHARDSGSTRTFTAVSPPAAALTISPNPALIGRAVTFDASASADAAHTIAKYEWDLDGDGTFELDTGGTPTATRSYDAVQTVHVTVRVTDSTGSTGTAAGDLKVSAIAIPSNLLGVTVNAGAQYTRSPDVTVTTNFPAGITSMVFANDGGFLTPTTFPPQNETKWKLDSSGPERLPKTIYVRFFTGVFPSETFTDDIILDETPPKVDSASVAPVAAASVARTARLRSWKAKLKATDSNSGVQFVQLTSNKKKPGKLLKYKQKLTVKSAKRPKWVRARDRAGNYSRWRKAR